jgi:hypothetical protein
MTSAVAWDDQDYQILTLSEFKTLMMRLMTGSFEAFAIAIPRPSYRVRYRGRDASPLPAFDYTRAVSRPPVWSGRKTGKG